VPIRRVVDRLSHLRHRLLKLGPHPPNQFVLADLRQPIHDNSLPGISTPESRLSSPTEKLADPEEGGG
jgi:hypothetical protein